MPPSTSVSRVEVLMYGLYQTMRCVDTEIATMLHELIVKG